jgi:hypothetical protein
MPQPSIEVVGVYRLPVTDDLLRDQIEILYGSHMSDQDRLSAMRECQDQLSSIVLVEALVKNRDGRFNVSDFTQPIDGSPREDWQAAWAEAYLDPDGESLMVERLTEPPTTEIFRVAFFLHYWQPLTPLNSSYGQLNCPAVEDMPDRLTRLVPYEPVD